MIEELTAPIIAIVLTVAGTVWWFRASVEKVIEKLYDMEQDLKQHTSEERVNNATSEVEHRTLKEQLDRIENNTKKK